MIQSGEVEKKFLFQPSASSFTSHRSHQRSFKNRQMWSATSSMTGIQGVTEMLTDAAGSWCGDERLSGPHEHS